MTRLSLVLAVLAIGCVDADEAPEIRALMPSQAAIGTTVDILGANFCGFFARADATCSQRPDAFVSFGGDAAVAAADAEAWSDDRVTLAVPASARVGATLVVVDVRGVASQPVAFEVLP